MNYESNNKNNYTVKCQKVSTEKKQSCIAKSQELAHLKVSWQPAALVSGSYLLLPFVVIVLQRAASSKQPFVQMLMKINQDQPAELLVLAVFPLIFVV